jgi:hypothetical protein
MTGYYLNTFDVSNTKPELFAYYIKNFRQYIKSNSKTITDLFAVFKISYFWGSSEFNLKITTRNELYFILDFYKAKYKIKEIINQVHILTSKKYHGKVKAAIKDNTFLGIQFYFYDKKYVFDRIKSL